MSPAVGFQPAIGQDNLPHVVVVIVGVVEPVIVFLYVGTDDVAVVFQTEQQAYCPYRKLDLGKKRVKYGSRGERMARVVGP